MIPSIDNPCMRWYPWFPGLVLPLLAEYLGSQCTKFLAAGWTCRFFTSFVRSSVSGLMRFRDGSDLGKSATETLAITREALGEESMGRTWKVQTHRDRKRRGRWRAKSSACHHFDIKWIFRIEFVLTGQTVNSAHYCDGLKRLRENARRLCPKVWRWNWLLYHDNAPSHTLFLTTAFVTKNNTTIVPIHPTSWLGPLWLFSVSLI
jgi:hypothetical protein